jgi:hypothetical protein
MKPSSIHARFLAEVLPDYLVEMLLPDRAALSEVISRPEQTSDPEPRHERRPPPAQRGVIRTGPVAQEEGVTEKKGISFRKPVRTKRNLRNSFWADRCPERVIAEI